MEKTVHRSTPHTYLGSALLALRRSLLIAGSRPHQRQLNRVKLGVGLDREQCHVGASADFAIDNGRPKSGVLSLSTLSTGEMGSARRAARASASRGKPLGHRRQSRSVRGNSIMAASITERRAAVRVAPVCPEAGKGALRRHPERRIATTVSSRRFTCNVREVILRGEVGRRLRDSEIRRYRPGPSCFRTLGWSAAKDIDDGRTAALDLTAATHVRGGSHNQRSVRPLWPVLRRAVVVAKRRLGRRRDDGRPSDRPERRAGSRRWGGGRYRSELSTDDVRRRDAP